MIEVQAVIAFTAADNDGKILWWAPAQIDSHVVECRGSAMEAGLIPYRDIRDAFEEDDWPTYGIWIWTGHGQHVDGTIRFDGGEWRSPSAHEWRAIQQGANPLR